MDHCSLHVCLIHCGYLQDVYAAIEMICSGIKLTRFIIKSKVSGIIFTKFRTGSLGDIFGDEVRLVELCIEETDMSMEEMKVMESCALNQDPVVEASENEREENQSDEDTGIYEIDDEDDDDNGDDSIDDCSYEENEFH